MEFANDLMAALRDRTGFGGATYESAGSGPVLDWFGLHARLSAAHAVRQHLAHSDSRPILLGGGFSDWPVAGCDEAKQTRGVNLNNSTDSKAPHGIEIDTADQGYVSGRGQT